MSNDTKNRKLKVAMLASASLLVPALAGTALAAEAQWKAVFTSVQKADPNDKAPTRTENGVTRLKKGDEKQPGKEQQQIAFGAEKRGLVIEMSSGALASGELPKNRIQAACTPVELVQAADGSVNLVANSAQARYITDNIGNEYRQANNTTVLAINGGKNYLVTYNWQKQGTNDTVRYAKVLDAQCNEVPLKNGNGQTVKQAVFFAKQNDDASGIQSGSGQELVIDGATNGGKNVVVAGHLTNGNGRDDSWMGEHHIDCQLDANGQATGCTVTRPFDVATCLNEERSRPTCTVSDEDPNTTICTCTDGNSQPQRRGVWMFAIDRSPGGEQGADAKSRLLWAEQVGGKTTVAGKNAYSMRIVQERLLVPDANGNLTRSPYVLVQWNRMLNTGNNNKGGVGEFAMGVAKPTRTGLEWVIPPTNTTDMFLAIDGTHLTSCSAVFGTNGNVMPGVTFLSGTQFGGSPDNTSAIKAIGVDIAGKKFVDLGMHATGQQYDRHLYPNYLGNNPDNQGRNFSGCDIVKNPFFGQNGNNVQYFQALAMSGKSKETLLDASIKLSSTAGLIATAIMESPATPPPATPPANDNTGTGNNATPGDSSATPPAQGTPDEAVEDPAAGASPSMMGCTAAPGGAGAGSALLIGLAFGFVAIIRRRRA